MTDFFEIDFLDVETTKSGDAIPLRYKLNGVTFIHVVDGGYQDTGQKVVDHVNKYYDNPDYIDYIVVSHPDRDHTGGLRTVLEEFEIGQLWMLRPWIYAEEIIDRFSRFTSVDNLKKRLKEVYPNIATLEEIAEDRDIPIYEPFQGDIIGAFNVMAPTKERYLDLIVESEKTPEAVDEGAREIVGLLAEALAKARAFVGALWGEEKFSSEETSVENEMSVVQYAKLCGQKILLTADAGRTALLEAADYAPYVGLILPGIDKFQVPHHGSRRNVSTEVLDIWLGPRLSTKPSKGEEKFTAIISSAKKDEDHPRKAVVRAAIHRGAKVYTTEGASLQVHHDAPERDGWGTAEVLPYPEEQED